MENWHDYNGALNKYISQWSPVSACMIDRQNVFTKHGAGEHQDTAIHSLTMTVKQAWHTKQHVQIYSEP